MMRISSLMSAVLLLTLLPWGVAPVQAQAGELCFPETGYCISGRMRQFWEQNGGLAVFGFPITPLQDEKIEGRSLQVQWFERNRLELHPENEAPYDVLLGRLGAARVARPSRVATPMPDGCSLFEATGQQVCGAVLAAWSASGLEIDGQPGSSPDESLALFGLPLTGLRSERLADGQIYQVQWFERARFELHPENQAPYNVLLGLLGNEASPLAAAPPLSPDQLQPRAAAFAGPPARMQVPAIGLDFPVVAVGVDGSGVPVVPDHDIGWFDQSALPGNGENVVLWGHVLRYRNAPNRPAPFARMKELQPGASLRLYDAAGNERRYVITQQVLVTPDQVEYILPQGREMLTMVSCYGEYVINNGEVVDMTNRLITIAEPEG